MKDGFHHRYWVYIVASTNGTLYTGLTGDLYKRIMQHKSGEVEGFSSSTNVRAWFITKASIKPRK